MGKGSNTTSTQSTNAPDPQAYAAYSQLLQRAQGVANTPYQAYTGELTSPVNAQQNLGIANINSNANSAQPAVSQALGLASGAANPLTAQQIANYQNPYTQSVVNATQAQFNNQNAQAQQGLTSNAIAQGALGGNRVGVAQGIMAGQQQLAQAPVIAGLYNTGYQQALQTAQQQYQQNPLAAAGAIANFGISGQNAALSGAGAQLGAGTLQQQTQQAADTANYGQYQQAQAYPFQTTQWLAGLDTGVGSNMGGTSNGTTTGPAPNPWSQALGVGLSAAGLFLNRGGRVERAQGGVVPQQHMADGGVSGTPWSGGVGWVPSLQIHGGSGAPQARAPSAPQQQSFDPSKFAQSVVGLGGKGSLSGVGNSIGAIFSPESYGGSLTGIAGASAYGGSSSNPLPGLTADDYGEGFARGGVVGYADGGDVNDDPGIMEKLARWSNEGRDQGQRKFYNDTRAGLMNSATAPEHGSTYGGLGLGLADRRHLQMYEAQDIADKVRGRKGYADGGAPDLDFGDRFSPAADQPFGEMTRAQALEHALAVGNPSRPVMVPATGVAPALTPSSVQDSSSAPVYDDGQGPVRLTGTRPVGNPEALKGTGIAASDDSDADTPEAATPTRGIATASGVAPAAAASGAWKPPYDITPADYAPPARDTGSSFGLGWLSPNAKSGLLAAGLGMLASRSPFLGNAVGEGGMAGLSAYGAAEERDRKAAEDAQKLSLEAKKAANDLSHQTFTTNETARHNKAVEEKEFKPTFGVVREEQDPDTGLTHKVYGWIDPNTKTAVPETTVPAGSPPPAPKVDSNGLPLTGQAYLDTLSPNRATLAKQIADYKVNPGGLSIRGGHREQAIADATRYNPDYDQRLFTASSRAMSNFYGGPEGRTVRSLNVAIDHLHTLDSAVDALKNGQLPVANKIINYFSQQTGSPVTTNFDSIKHVVSAEIAKAVVGGQTALHDRDDMAARAANSGSPEQLHGIVTEFKKLMAGQMKGLRKQYEVTTRAKNFDDFLEPQTKKELSSLPDVEDNYNPNSAPAGGGFTPPAGAIARQYNGKTYYYDPNTKQPYPGQ